MALTKEQIKEFKEELKEAEGCYGFYSLARKISYAGDKEWAKKVYKKAEEKAEDCSDYSSLAASIHEEIGDKEWAKKVYKKAEGKAEDSSDFRDLAQSIFEKLDDKEGAKKVYKKSEEKADDCYDFIALAASIHKELGDKEWAKKVYKKAEEKAEDSDEYEDLAESIRDTLGDKKWAAIVKKKKKATKKQVLSEISLSGPELTYYDWTVKEKNINSIQKLNDTISDLIEGGESESTAHLVLGKLESSKATNLDETFVSIEHSDGDDVDISVKNKGNLIKNPKKGEIVFVYFYYYDHSSHTLNPKKKFKNISLEIKSFQGEAVLTKTDYPNFDLTAEDASGGGEYRLEIYCDDDQSFEGTVANKENLIEEFSDYLTDKGVIKTKGEEKSR
jgi:tetratricopeptide (TPR) repeat protein